MDEAIGTKNGQSDRKRSLIVKKEQYQKLLKYKHEQEKKEEQEIEKKLKINQVKTAAVAFPLVLTGIALKELASPKNGQEISIKRKEDNKEPLTIAITTKKYDSFKEKDKSNEEATKTPQIVQKIEQNTIPLPGTLISSSKNLENLKEREIINRYEEKLKEIKIELKELIFEYNIIVKEYDNILESKEVEKLLEKLNLIIKKLDELKDLIEIPNTKDYDQNYIDNLISEYLTDFKKNKVVEEIKDSQLYILLSSKIEELDQKKDLLEESLIAKKEEINLDEEKLVELKECYKDFDNFNNNLLRFQADQDALTRNLEQKIANAKTEQEKVETRLHFLKNQTSLILDLIRPQLLIPGARSTIRLALAASCLVHFMKNNIRPTVETKRYKVINVADYTKDITNSLKDLDNALSLLKRSKKELQLFLEEFKNNYKKYFKEVKECDQLLENLQNCLFSLEEKEEEIERLKMDQEKNLMDNHEKVKQIGKYEII